MHFNSCNIELFDSYKNSTASSKNKLGQLSLRGSWGAIRDGVLVSSAAEQVGRPPHTPGQT